MKDYDGPSFYRKYFDGEVPFKGKKNEEVDEKQLNRYKRDETIKQNDNRPVNSDLVTEKITGAKHDKGYVSSGKSLRELTERFVPANHGKKHENYYTLGHHQSLPYIYALREMEKNDDEYILFSDTTKVVHSGETADQNLFNFDSEEVDKDYGFEVTDGTDEPISENENNNENTVDNSKRDVAEARVNKELGHSLGDIFEEESGLAKNLTFFNKDKDPEVKEVVDVKPRITTTPQSEQQDPITMTGGNDHIEDTLYDASQKMEAVTDLKRDPKNTSDYTLPSLSLINPPVKEQINGMDDWIKQQAQTLDDTLKAFNVHAHVVDWTNGPTVTQFQLKLDLGVKVNKITNLNDDLKMALAAKDIRIEAPIPGKSTVGIEIPNPQPRPVMLSEILDSKSFNTKRDGVQVSLGMNIEGETITTSLQKMPHALIAGATGSGKSVFINSLLLSLLFEVAPEELRMILIDPKAVELAPYNGIPHLLTPVISDAKEAAAALKWVTKEMDERYERLAGAGVRNIEQYNEKVSHSMNGEKKLPLILVVIDELADLMMVASTEVQDYIVRITQKARAAGIHLIVATQRPSVDIVTGTIKNNIPTRIAFGVSSQVDSRTIIDQSGAERLLGKGDMLYLGAGASKPVRLQGAFVSNEEVDRVVSSVKRQGEPDYAFEPKMLAKSAEMAQSHDELWKEVLKYISEEENVSTSKLQRTFSIGYNRSASIIDDLERANFISGQHGSKPREVYLTKDAYQKLNI